MKRTTMNTYTVSYRRKREGKTDYKKRLKLLLGRTPRIVVRKTNSNIIVQVVDYLPDGDHVKVGTSSRSLIKLGWNFSRKSIPASYLTGLLVGKKAVKLGITDAVVDLGLQNSLKGSKLYAAVKGAIDAGMNIPCGESAFPSEDRLNAKHIENYAKSAKKGVFAKNVKDGFDPKQMSKSLELLKSKILKGE